LVVPQKHSSIRPNRIQNGVIMNLAFDNQDISMRYA
jgi:hypothetical protein